MATEITSGDILSQEQLSKHMKIFAGPGAGKTHFLVENIKNIVAMNPTVAKSKSRKVLCITYTNAAVEEIKRRLDRFSSAVDINTIHGFIIEHIINPFQEDLKKIIFKDFGITVGKNLKLSSQIEGLGILHGVDKDEIYEYIAKRAHVSEPLTYSKMKMGDVQSDNELYLATGQRKLIQPKNVDAQHVKPIKEFTWSVVNKLTHNEILYFGYRILEENSTALYATRVKFPFIFVDEFQDTNPMQTQVIKLLGEKSTVIGIIGDVAQSIYSFQGAKPTQFQYFSMQSDREMTEYTINGNRRSTNNIVNMCNYLRKSDGVISQKSIRQYESKEVEIALESSRITFLIGVSTDIMNKISQLVTEGGVILTRAWAAAFQYIQGVDPTQIELLRRIYNSYYRSPIDIRAEIAEHNNVPWVRAFKFIFSFWEGYTTGSFIDIINALSLYGKIDKHKFVPNFVIQIKKIAKEVFENLSETEKTVDILNRFNRTISKSDYLNLRRTIFSEDFTISYFSELDDENLVRSVSDLDWKTAYKLFTEVFSKDSKYMTVHQAKGLEWDKVIVSVTPNQFDKTTLAQLFTNPQLLRETSTDEFTRMYYVACSRAKSELYIHLSDCSLIDIIRHGISTFCADGQEIKYTIEYN